MFDRVGPTEVVGRAIASGYSLVFNKPNMKVKVEGLPNLKTNEEGKVFGMVFELSRRQLEDLSGYFGGYEPKEIKVTLEIGGENRDETVLAFIARRTKSDLKPTATSIELTRKAMEENGAAGSFIEALKTFEVINV
ncbi:MAG: gamma-glutamylcyclotransferase [Deltaproteobacteria bacterium]|nr:gamma-glutamylcyclotransferase [Deltaproteobacteria bacterium]